MWIQAGWIAIGDLPGSMDGGAWLTWRLYCGAPTACGPAKNRRNGMSCVELTGLRADLPIGVMAALIEDVKGAADRKELLWSEQIKTATRESFVEHAKLALAGDDGLPDWFAAFGSALEIGLAP